MNETPNKCRYCGVPIPPAQKTGRPRYFCLPSHRAAWHSAQRQKALEDSIAALNLSASALRVAQAGISDALQRIVDQLAVLESLRHKPRQHGVLRDSIPIDSQQN